jgi:hypothetical protein
MALGPLLQRQVTEDSISSYLLLQRATGARAGSIRTRAHSGEL